MSIDAFVQYDWCASRICRVSQPAVSYDAGLGIAAEAFVQKLKDLGFNNVATWADEATGVHSKNPETDAIRNTDQVAESDYVITRCFLRDPKRGHWGSIAVVSYALGAGIPCVIIAEKECCIWSNHMMRHPNILAFYNEADFFVWAAQKSGKRLKVATETV